MDFTELYRQSAFLCHFSPDARYIATAVDHRVVVRDAESLHIRFLFSCTDTVSDLAWAPDSDLILFCSYKKGITQVRSLKDPEWTATMEEGAAGLTAVRWAPDGRHVLTFSDFQLRITVWSLISSEVAYIQYPKYSNKGFSFRKDGRYFALSERRESRDTVSLYDCEDWTLLKVVYLAFPPLYGVGLNLGRFYFSTFRLQYKVFIYYPDGRLIKSFSAYTHGLGIKNGLMVRLLNHFTWTPLIEFSHPSNLPFPDIELRPPVTIVHVKPDIDKANPRRGVGICEFSCDGRFLATRNGAQMPNTLWIWDLVNLCQVALIQQLHPIKQVRWNPLRPNLLAYTCGGTHIYVWGGPGLGCEAIEVPTIDFSVQQVRWSGEGGSLLLMDKEKFCLAFLLQDEEVFEEEAEKRGAEGGTWREVIETEQPEEEEESVEELEIPRSGEWWERRHDGWR
ncbi:hypothetical protein BC829DRAFT_426733 [Chytridium lagenaria]|nr:hypothetical protein BC829DRAFT_426733 [Chytridium lagenaria]